MATVREEMTSSAFRVGPVRKTVNSLECKGIYCATSTNMKLVHWPLIGGLRSHSLHRTVLAVPNVTAHPSTATVPITVLLCSGMVG